jgi:hypothetical protein
MLGCQDFCGYYEWTFHHVRRRWGQEGLADLLSEAIGRDSQRHYAEAGARAGLRGLYDTWTKTGQDEHCDWTFTLDQRKNVLRCDMRRCPSKGFLVEHDLNADEDYCNHCAGWMIPMLEGIGAELVEHEHNHCGQCWMTIRMKDRPSEPLQVENDIRNDPRWRHGYLDRWSNSRALSLMPSVCASSDSCDVLAEWFARYPRLAVLEDSSPGQSGTTEQALEEPVAILATGAMYADEQRCPLNPAGVLLDHDTTALAAVASRFLTTPVDNRPLLMHPFLRALPPIDFIAFGLPRPMPILPILIRAGLYTHRPGGPHPDARQWLHLLVDALRST